MALKLEVVAGVRNFNLLSKYITHEVLSVQVEQLNSTDASTRHKVAACVRELEGEIRTLQKLKHPNIVQYLGFERTETHFNIFLEWMPGGSIRKLLDDFGVPNPHLGQQG